MRLSALLALGLLLTGAPGRAAAQAPPKVAVVVAGDPDAALVAAAAETRAALEAQGQLLLPRDATLVQALEGGAAPAEDDGLGELRAARRRLALSEQAARGALAQLGQAAGAVALLVVARGPAPQLRVYDLGRGRYFAGALALPADPEALGAFVGPRAAAAARHAARPAEPARAPLAVEAPQAAPQTAPQAAAAAEPARERRLSQPARRGLALGAAGALLVGALSFVLVTQLRDEPEPVLNIRPGGS